MHGATSSLGWDLPVVSRDLALAHPSIEDARGFLAALRQLLPDLPRGLATSVVIGFQDGLVEHARGAHAWPEFASWVLDLRTWIEPRLPRGWHGSLRLHVVDGRLVRVEIRRVLQ